MGINNEIINIFIEVYETESISEAGRNLFYTKQTISKSIATLEKELCIKLFDRSKRKLEKTKECKLIYDKLKYLQLELNKLGKSYRNSNYKEVRVASCYNLDIAQNLIDTVDEFYNEDVKFNYTSCHSDEALNKLIKNECDIGLFCYEVNESKKIKEILHNNNCTYKVLFVSEPAVIISSNNKISRKKYIIPKDLNGLKRVEPNFNKDCIINYRDYMRRSEIYEIPHIRSSSMSNLVSLVANNNYYAFDIYTPNNKYNLDCVTKVPLKKTGVKVELVCGIRDEFVKTKESKIFIDNLQALYGGEFIENRIFD